MESKMSYLILFMSLGISCLSVDARCLDDYHRVQIDSFPANSLYDQAREELNLRSNDSIVGRSLRWQGTDITDLCEYDTLEFLIASNLILTRDTLDCPMSLRLLKFGREIVLAPSGTTFDKLEEIYFTGEDWGNLSSLLKQTKVVRIIEMSSRSGWLKEFRVNSFDNLEYCHISTDKCARNKLNEIPSELFLSKRSFNLIIELNLKGKDRFAMLPQVQSLSSMKLSVPILLNEEQNVSVLENFKGLESLTAYYYPDKGDSQLSRLSHVDVIRIIPPNHKDKTIKGLLEVAELYPNVTILGYD